MKSGEAGTMPIIKRYPNRKLYNTESKQYITLEEISNLIREGAEVRVINHASGEDLTAVTLTQIIFELEKKERGFLPRAILSGLIQAGGERIGAIQRTLATTLGLSHLVDEEIRHRLNVLAEEGELDETEAKKIQETLIDPRFRSIEESRLRRLFEFTPFQDLDNILVDLEIPTRNDLQKLFRQIDELTAKIDQIEEHEV
jgi:polyhydroxyalkanoate synthesis repressor PhaR